MILLKNVVILLIGFVLLVKGADYFVEGSSSVAKKFGIPSIIVGLTIVAMGTSFPELAVSVTAGLSGSNEIAISNVVGSNIFNLIVVLGVCSIISPIKVDKEVMKRDMPFLIFITFILVAFVCDRVFPWTDVSKDREGAGILSRFDSIIFIIIFTIYLVITVKSALAHMKSNKIKNSDSEDDGKEVKTWLSIVFIIGGIIAIKFGGDFVVNSASYIATEFGMSETLVGLTIVAVGTSLPELVTSIVAAKKGETSLAIGNVVGSNIFNILLILGVSGTIHPITVIMDNCIDLFIVLICTVLVFIFAKLKDDISRFEGAVMVAVYVGYMAYAILR